MDIGRSFELHLPFIPQMIKDRLIAKNIIFVEYGIWLWV
jgi:hypothetical protein